MKPKALPIPPGGLGGIPQASVGQTSANAIIPQQPPPGAAALVIRRPIESHDLAVSVAR
jgi:hypothetical protein